MDARSTRFVVGSLVGGFVVALLGGGSVRAQQPGAQPSGEFYRNVQVLKALPAHLMQPTMQLMEIGLGVHCVYCHDADNTKRDLDTKPQKLVARRMIQMVGDINRTQFGGREVVTCFTCHQGHTRPTTVVPYDGEDARPAVVAVAQPPTPEQLLDRYATAVGGAEAIAKAPGRTLRGRVTNYGHLDEVHAERAPTLVTPLEVMAKGPDRRLVVQHNIAADAVTAYNGTASWTRAGVAAPADMRPDVMEVARLENGVMYPATFKQMLMNLKVEGQEKVGDRTAWVVSGSTNWLPKVKLYFDRDTAYLLSITYQQKSGYCCHVFRVDYDNFYIGSGIRTPLKWTVHGPRESMLVYEFDSLETGAIDDSRFARPQGTATASR